MKIKKYLIAVFTVLLIMFSTNSVYALEFEKIEDKGLIKIVEKGSDNELTREKVKELQGFIKENSKYTKVWVSKDIKPVNRARFLFKQEVSDNLKYDIEFEEGFNTSKVYDMEGMFQNFKGEIKGLENWDVSEVWYMNDMFNGATSASPDLSNWNPAKNKRQFDHNNYINCTDMFVGTKVKKIDIRNWEKRGKAWDNDNYNKFSISDNEKNKIKQSCFEIIATKFILNSEESHKKIKSNFKDYLMKGPAFIRVQDSIATKFQKDNNFTNPSIYSEDLEKAIADGVKNYNILMKLYIPLVIPKDSPKEGQLGDNLNKHYVDLKFEAGEGGTFNKDAKTEYKVFNESNTELDFKDILNYKDGTLGNKKNFDGKEEYLAIPEVEVTDPGNKFLGWSDGVTKDEKDPQKDKVFAKDLSDYDKQVTGAITFTAVYKNETKPKTAYVITTSTESAVVVEGQDITPITVSVEKSDPKKASSQPATLSSSGILNFALLGNNLTYDRAADNAPTVSVEGLPAGLSYDSNTGKITGKATVTDWGKDEKERSFTVTIKATDASGNPTIKTITITVQKDTDKDGIPDVLEDDPAIKKLKDEKKKLEEEKKELEEAKKKLEENQNSGKEEQEKLNKQITEKDKEIEKLKEEKQKLETSKNELEEAKKKLEEEKGKIEKDKTDLTNKNEKLEKEKEAKEKQIEEKEKKIKEIEGKNKDLTNKNQALEKQNQENDNKIAELNKKVKKLEATKKKLEEEKKELEAAKNKLEQGQNGGKDEQENLNKQIKEKDEKIKELEEEKQQLEASKKKLEEEKGKIEKENKDLTNKNQALEKQNQENTNKIAELNRKVKELEEAKKKLEDEKQKCGDDNKLKELQNQITEKDKEIEKLKKEIKELKNSCKPNEDPNANGENNKKPGEGDNQGEKPGNTPGKKPGEGDNQGEKPGNRPGKKPGEGNNQGEKPELKPEIKPETNPVDPNWDDYLINDEPKTKAFPVFAEVKNTDPKDTKIEQTGKKVQYTFAIDSNKYKEVQNGETKEINIDVAPFIKNNKTMLPLRYIAESIGAKVEWNNETRTATFTKGEIKAEIQIDSQIIKLKDGKTIKLEAKPQIIKDRIFLPLTNISEIFGLTNGNTDDGINQDIEWDHDTKTVTINVKK